MLDKANDFTVLVCIKDALEEVEKCLSSIVKHTPNYSEIILVNDNSKQPTIEFLETFAKKIDDVRLISNKEILGYTKSLNIGLKKVNSRFVLVVNSDVIVTHNWSEKLIKPMLEHGDVGIVSPLSNAAFWQSVPYIFDKSGNYYINEIPSGYNLESFSREIEELFFEEFAEVCLVNGFCMAIRRSLFANVGFFDETNFPIGYGEEADFCIRTLKKGYRNFVKLDTYIYHFKSRSFGSEHRKELIAKGNEMINFLYGSRRFKRLYRLMRYHKDINRVRNTIRAKYYSREIGGLVKSDLEHDT